MRLRNLVTGEVSERDVDGLFVAIGHIPNTQVFKGQLHLDPDGYLLFAWRRADEYSGRSVSCVGDVQDRVYRQAITASGDGLHGGH